MGDMISWLRKALNEVKVTSVATATTCLSGESDFESWDKSTGGPNACGLFTGNNLMAKRL